VVTRTLRVWKMDAIKTKAWKNLWTSVHVSKQEYREMCIHLECVRYVMKRNKLKLCQVWSFKIRILSNVHA
jgi:hypothetical protein